jgi:hypothetical protein
MNEFRQDYENEKQKYLNTTYTHTHKVTINKVENLFSLSNLLRSRFELELGRGCTTDEYIEMIRISSSFINTEI